MCDLCHHARHAHHAPLGDMVDPRPALHLASLSHITNEAQSVQPKISHSERSLVVRHHQHGKSLTRSSQMDLYGGTLDITTRFENVSHTVMYPQLPHES